MKILLMNPNVGSGIEETGNEIKYMLREFDPIEYKYQNPPSLILEYLIDEEPDVIIQNEYYSRILEGISYHKIVRPNTRFLLINHSSRGLASDLKQKDDRHQAVKKLLKNERSHIINLNYIPEDLEWPSFLSHTPTQSTFPLKRKYKILIPFMKRERNFLYFGRVLEDRLSEKFLSKIGETDIRLDTIGKMKSDSNNYIEKLERSTNIRNHGYIKEIAKVPLLNNFRFMIVSPRDPQVFNRCVQQGIACGCIPLFVEDHRKSDWIEWTEGSYFSFKNDEELISWMQEYENNPLDYSDESINYSQKIRKKCDPEKIKQKILEVIDIQEE